MAQNEISLNNWDNAHIEAAPLRKIANVFRYGQFVGSLAECVGTGFYRLTPFGGAWGYIRKGLTRRAWDSEGAAATAIQSAGCHIGD